MSKIPVSICMIAKNEEHFLEECLKRIKPYGFEIVLTDTGSTDRTKEIAAKYADKVLDFPWVNDFSAARNYCAKHASNNWIITLDCDEYVENLDVGVLRILMQKKPKSAGNIRMKILVLDSKGDIQYTTEDVTRMYNRNYYAFEGAIHEQITPFEWQYDAEGNNILDSFMVPIEVVHQGYAQSKEAMREKQIRNLSFIEAALEKEPNDPYLLFQKGQSLFILRDIEQAIKIYEEVMSYNPSRNYLYVQLTIMGLAKGYMVTGREEEALALLKKYEGECKTAKYVFTQASFYMDCKQWMKSLLYYIKATTMPDRDALGVNLLHSYENIISLYKGFGDEKMAGVFQKQYEDCLKERERIMGTVEQ